GGSWPSSTATGLAAPQRPQPDRVLLLTVRQPLHRRLLGVLVRGQSPHLDNVDTIADQISATLAYQMCGTEGRVWRIRAVCRVTPRAGWAAGGGVAPPVAPPFPPG